jgi:hypothetical protein
LVLRGRDSLMGRCSATALLLISLLGCESALASKASEEGWEQFGVDLLPSEHRAADDSWSVMVWAWSDSDSLHGTSAFVRLVTGPNTQCSSEDLTKNVPLGPAGAGNVNWPVRLVTKGDGPQRIGATIRIGHPGSPALDEQEVVLDVTIRGGSIQVQGKECVRAIRVEHGRRFRYGGKYLVAIDPSEREHACRSVGESPDSRADIPTHRSTRTRFWSPIAPWR